MEIPRVLWMTIAVILLVCANFVSPDCVTDYMTCAIEYNRVASSDDCAALKIAADCFPEIDTSGCGQNLREMILSNSEEARRVSDGCGVEAVAECDVNDYQGCSLEYNGGISANNCNAIKSGVDCFKSLDTSNCDAVMTRTIIYQVEHVTNTHAKLCLGATPGTPTSTDAPSMPDDSSITPLDDSTTESSNDRSDNDDNNDDDNNDGDIYAENLIDSAQNTKAGMLIVLMCLLYIVMIKIIT